MDKYKLTAGLNYLKENSYKGDGSPGMVMGIASDARGDTNTYENKKPTTSSKHSSERDLKKYDPYHGHSHPEGNKPAVCSCITSDGPSTDCTKCDGTGQITSPIRTDPKVDEGRFDPSILDPEHDPRRTRPEGGNPQECTACNGSGKAKKYTRLPGRPAVVPCQACGGTGDVISKQRNDPKVDEALEEIKRLSGLGEARKERPDVDDFDDEEDEKVEDPDADKVQHIVMQLRKAQDVDGDHPIKFEDSTKVKLPLTDINLFMTKYMDMKPRDREKMQQVAIMSKEKFDTILSFFQPTHGKPEKSLYEKK